MRVLIGVVAGLLLILLFGRSVAVFYTDALWFDALGQSSVFWTRIWTVIGVRMVTGAVGAALILLNLWYVLRQLGPVHLRRRYGNLEIAEQVPRSYLVGGAIATSILAGWWLSTLQFGTGSSLSLVAWLRSGAWGIADPLFERDLSYYIFALPAQLRLLDYLLLVFSWAALLVGIGYVLVGAVRVAGSRWHIDDRPRVHFAVLAAAVLVVLAIRWFVARHLLLIDGNGFNGAIGYTDVHARLPARIIISVLLVLAAGALVWGAVRRVLLPPLAAGVVLVLAVLGAGVAYPAIVQQLQVEPNQLAREIGYIRWNLEFTRRAYGLDQIDRRSFEYVRATADTWADATPTLQQLPLWDPEPLQTALTQVQAQRAYYQFPDVDYDRYGPPGDRRQVAIAVREFTKEGLSENARTWQTVHLNPIFTRGLGVVATPVADKLRGEPVYWVSDVLPVQSQPDAPPGLELTEPSIYFGETMTDYAVVGYGGSFTRELDDMPGRVPAVPEVTTGISLDHFGRVLSFAWRFGDQNLLFATELGPSSRLIFRRGILERLNTLAPFLVWDQDPHPVVLNGRVVWLVDGYTTSAFYPIARPVAIQGLGRVSYMRGSVKAVVDGVTGEVGLYAVDEPDPILATWMQVFPDLVRPWSELPPGLGDHLRYPVLLFRVQADVLDEYHLERAELFYAGQDVWQLPQEISPSQRQRYRPAFMMAAMPGSTDPEFLLINAFIARERQNMTGLLVARSDPPHYGELVLLEIPDNDQVKGPAQVQSLIEQDPTISQQLSLWRQLGTTVEMGRLRTIPTARSLLYVEPIYLIAQDQGIPQLQRVIVSDGTTVAMADDLPAAVAQLTGRAVAQPREPSSGDVEPAAPGAQPPPWADDALRLLRRADERLRAGDFAGFGAAWNELRELLQSRAGGQ